MPTYFQPYRMQFQTVGIAGVSIEVTVDITDTATSSGTPIAITYLEGAGTPLRFETVNNGRDPFQSIVARNAVLSFRSSTDYSSRTFASGTDNRFKVKASVPAATLFEGFLLADETEERFLNPSAKNEITLVATDNIGTLKEVELKDPDTGEALTNAHYSLLWYIQTCLAKTGLSLNLNISWNIFEDHFSDTESPLAQAFLYALTFEKNATDKEDCYTVLQKIVTGLKARLFQWGGEWWLVRLHEYRTDLDTLSRITYRPDGTISASFDDYPVTYTVQADTDLRSLAGGRYSVQRQHKFDKDIFKLETPKEIPQNKGFTRGTFNGVIDPYRPQRIFANLAAFPDPGEGNVFYYDTDTGLYYQWIGDHYEERSALPLNISNWTLELFGGGTPTVLSYIRRVFDSRGQEDAHYAVIGAGSGEHWIKSEAISLTYKDKFSFGVDWRLSENLNSGGYFTIHIAQLRLYGEDGSYWTLNGNPNLENIGWVKTNAAFSITNRYISTTYSPNEVNELQDWQTVSVEAPPLPVSGELYVLLRKNNYNNTAETYFSNLQFEYIPYINGSYQRYSAMSDTITQTDPFKANRQEDLFVHESPRKLFKGALKYDNGTGYALCDLWTDTFDSGASGANKLGKLLVYDTWNQYRKARDFVSLTVKGFMPKYSFLLSKTILADYSTTKRFICLREDYNVKRLEANLDFLEVFDTDETNDYTTAHTFKYEQ